MVQFILGRSAYSEAYEVWELVECDGGETVAETDLYTEQEIAGAQAWAVRNIEARGRKTTGGWVDGDPDLHFQHYTIEAELR